MSDRKNIAIFGVGVVSVPVLAEILRGLSDRYSITVYSFISADKKTVLPGIRVRYLPRFLFHQRLKYFVLGMLFILDHFRSRYKAIHAQSAFPGGVIARFLGKIFNIPWMVTLIGGEAEAMPEIPFGDLLNHRLRKITLKVCTDCRFLTVMSAYHADSVRKNLNLSRPITVLPYAPHVKSIGEKKITFPVQLLHVGYHHPVKNQAMLLSVMSKLVKEIPCTLTIIGANYGKDFEHQVNVLQLGKHIRLIGPKQYAEIEQFYHEAHILLHTSWYEGLPTVAFEAMAHGAVVCGTHVGIMADLSGTHCVTVAPGDDVGMVQKILALVHDQKRYDMLRSESFAWAKRNGLDHYIAEMSAMYEEMIIQK